MSLREQYRFLFDVTYNGMLRERFVTEPQTVLTEERLDPEEFRPLTQGRINRLGGESLARKAYYLNIFFSCFPKTTFVLTSACKSMEPLNSFFSSPHFLNCFSSDESFVDAFNAFLTEQAGHHAGRVPSLPDLHSYEWALYQLRTNPARDDHGSTSETPLDHARPLILASHVLLRQFSYPITEIVDYIDYFTASSWYRLAPLYAAAGQTMPSLVIPHAALSEPLLVLLTLRGAEHRILKIKRSQYDALAACDGTRTYDQVLVNVEQSERPRVGAWLNHCRQNRMLEYFEP